MRKRTVALLAAGSLIASIMAIGPASAQDAAAPIPVPAEPNITDLAADSNGLNDQGDGTILGDNAGGLSFSSGDYLDVWFTTTDKLNVHIHTTTPGGGGNWAIIYRIYVNDGCDALQGTIGGKSNVDAAPTASIRDFCSRGIETLPGEIKVETYEDGTGLTTLSFPLGAWPGLEMGSTLTTPYGTSRIVSPAATAPQTDTTAAGTDYTIASGDPSAPPAGTPGENPPPDDGEVGNDDPDSGGPKPDPKKDCKGKKGKAKKKCKKNAAKPDPKPASCDAYVPGERGAEAETTLVTEEATEAAPIELEMAPGPSVGLFYGIEGEDNPLITHDYINIQVDTKGEPMGLYARVEFAEGEDQDVFLRNVDDSIAAQAAGGNQATQVMNDSTHGGHSELTAEQLDGILTADCGGYTFEVSNAFGFGESVVKLWLGPATWDPVAQAPIG